MIFEEVRAGGCLSYVVGCPEGAQLVFDHEAECPAEILGVCAVDPTRPSWYNLCVKPPPPPGVSRP